jgi:pyridoxine 5-phosphate synthase
MKLGINIDHVATVREARGVASPDPVEAAMACIEAGCDSIVCHLREDRRHIKDDDVWRLREVVRTRLNLEMSIAKDIVDIACEVRPEQATLVPEKRRELTTEGGLDVVKYSGKISDIIRKFGERKIETSLFINPSRAQIAASKRAGASIIELHTGRYADARTEQARAKELDKIKRSVEYAASIGLEVNVGHGLNYANVRDVAAIKNINELNIGHSIVARAIIVGMRRAVEEMIGSIR